MEKSPIKVFARLRDQAPLPQDKIYEIFKKQDYEEVTFSKSEENIDVLNNKNKPIVKYRFQQVFENATQNEIFENVAKPVVNSVLEGYNGTIFAYGQTGTGKTYSIRGVTDDPERKGIIPRTLEYIFSYIKKADGVFSICISYMEIYNETAYDLLRASNILSLEELPRVVLLEDSEGNVNLRNLRVESVASEEEAMRLFKFGESNRKIAETPSNPRSSRSHCLFTIHISGFLENEGKVRRSKLHLVDLAGSERVFKTGLSGVVLTEALNINLSLHFLEQVILALSEPKRTHIPYRNSVMTTVLRDSLGGNCLTTMLATFSPSPKNLQETISTCKFAQRVAMVKSELSLVDEMDPQQEIASLKMEVESLRKQLSLLKQEASPQQVKNEELTTNEIEDCKKELKSFLDGTVELLSDDSRKTNLYLQMLRKMVLLQSNEVGPLIKGKNKDVKSTKERSIHTVVNMDDMKPKSLPPEKSKYNAEIEKELKAYEKSLTADMTGREKEAFKIVTSDPNTLKELNMLVEELKDGYETAKTIAERIDQCKINVETLKKRINKCSIFNIEEKIVFEKKLKVQETIYEESIVQLQRIKMETDNIKQNIDKTKKKLLAKSQEMVKNLEANTIDSHNLDRNYFDEINDEKFSSKPVEDFNASKVMHEIFNNSFQYKTDERKLDNDSSQGMHRVNNEKLFQTDELIGNNLNFRTPQTNRNQFNLPYPKYARNDVILQPHLCTPAPSPYPQSSSFQRSLLNQENCQNPQAPDVEYYPRYNTNSNYYSQSSYRTNDFACQYHPKEQIPINPYAEGCVIPQRPYSSYNVSRWSSASSLYPSQNPSSQKTSQETIPPHPNKINFENDYYHLQRFSQQPEMPKQTTVQQIHTILDDSERVNFKRNGLNSRRHQNSDRLHFNQDNYYPVVMNEGRNLPKNFQPTQSIHQLYQNPVLHQNIDSGSTDDAPISSKDTGPRVDEDVINLDDIPLTGDPEVDAEIIAFYKSRE